MAKLVILKSLMDAYYENMIEKSTSHKYIRRVPKSSGKGYNYFYAKDFKTPFKALLSFFGMIISFVIGYYIYDIYLITSGRRNR